MIIGIAGKAGSGKNTVAKMIQYLTSLNTNLSFDEWINSEYDNHHEWQIHSFADKVKDVTSHAWGVNRNMFENFRYKDWCYMNYRTGEICHYDDLVNCENVLRVEDVQDLKRILCWDFIGMNEGKVWILLRTLLQFEGDLGREYRGSNSWVRALFMNYIRYKFENDKKVSFLQMDHS